MIRLVKPSPPAILCTRGLEATKALCRARNRGRRIFDFDRGIYAHDAVKAALLSAQHGKCCFCEAYVAHIQFGDVEHFRPKRGCRQSSRAPLMRPGYYWLAYDWSNLFLCCEICNRRHKGTLFPLRNPTRRARAHAHSVPREKPVFIDPAADDPEKFIGFHDEVAFPIANNRRGRETIEALQLNRLELQRCRRSWLVVLKNLKADRDLLAHTLAETTNSDAELLDKMARRLKEIDALLSARQQDSAEYAGMARALLGR
jgi:uncharacterized protein (TIGR02646 family)